MQSISSVRPFFCFFYYFYFFLLLKQAIRLSPWIDGGYYCICCLRYVLVFRDLIITQFYITTHIKRNLSAPFNSNSGKNNNNKGSSTVLRTSWDNFLVLCAYNFCVFENQIVFLSIGVKFLILSIHLKLLFFTFIYFFLFLFCFILLYLNCISFSFAATISILKELILFQCLLLHF